MVHERLEDGEVAEQLVRQRVAERVQLRWRPLRGGGLHAVMDAAADGPVEPLRERGRVQIQVAVLEERLRLPSRLVRVVQHLQQLAQPAGLRDRLAERVELGGDRVGAGGQLEVVGDGRLLGRAEDVHHEDGVVRGDGAAVLSDEARLRHLLGVADLLCGVDHGVGVLLHGVVHARGAGAEREGLVVDAEAAAHVQELRPEAAADEPGVDPRDLAHARLERAHVADLAPQVEVQQLERLRPPLLDQPVRQRDELGEAHAELGQAPARARPRPGRDGRQLDADAERGLLPGLVGEGQDLLQLGDLLHDGEHAAAQALERQDEPQHRGVFVAVDEAERVVGLQPWQRGDELGLGAALDPAVELAPGLHDLVHDLAQLVHLDGVHGGVAAAVAGFCRGLREGAVQRADARGEHVLEPDDGREREPPRDDLVHDGREVDPGVRARVRAHAYVAAVVDAEEAFAPGGHVVEGLRVGGRPGGGGGNGRGQRRAGSGGARSGAEGPENRVPPFPKFRGTRSEDCAGPLARGSVI